jgi:multisubunit Na+/H+ antiporter MnhB subunit
MNMWSWGWGVGGGEGSHRPFFDTRVRATPLLDLVRALRAGGSAPAAWAGQYAPDGSLQRYWAGATAGVMVALLERAAGERMARAAWDAMHFARAAGEDAAAAVRAVAPTAPTLAAVLEGDGPWWAMGTGARWRS